MEELERAFSQSDSVVKSEGSVNESFICDPIGQLIDKLASEYNWTDEYILDQPYPKLRALLDCVDIRHYHNSIEEYQLKVYAAGGGSKSDIEKYFESIKPKIRTTQTQEISYLAADMANVPDFSGFVHIVKE